MRIKTCCITLLIPLLILLLLDMHTLLGVVSRSSKRVSMRLPDSDQTGGVKMEIIRTKSGSAVNNTNIQSFNVGMVTLPTSSFKHREKTGGYTLLFTVHEAERNMLEYTLNSSSQRTQRFLLQPLDAFWVPPGNEFKLTNHSTTQNCKISIMTFYGQ